MNRLSIGPRNASNSTSPNFGRVDRHQSVHKDGLYGEYVYHDDEKRAQMVIASDNSRKSYVDTRGWL